MPKKFNVLSGLTSLSLSLLAFSIIGNTIADENAPTLNDFFKVETTKVIDNEADHEADTLYYKSSYGDKIYSDKNFLSLREDTIEQTKNEIREGAVLLFNPDNILPFTNVNRVTLLGHASLDPVYKSNSAGNKVYPTSRDLVTLTSALESQNISVNPQMNLALEKGTAARGVRTTNLEGPFTIANGSGKGNEEPLSFYENNKKLFSSDYKDACIITLAREASEGVDMIMDDDDDEGGQTGKISSLALHKNEKDLLKFARENFSKVVVLLNSPYQLETEEIKKFSDAILYIGQPGLTGFAGVSEILVGKTNPSGHLTDTYATSSLSSPAVINSGTRTQTFSNYETVMKPTLKSMNASHLSFQAENIYIGYKYYETRYYDQVRNRFNATDAVGSSNGNSWNYSSEITFPFGYGLSYSEFKQTLDSVTVQDESILVKVTVTNIGEKAGKSVVQLYSQTPYENYEISNGVEKPAIQLAGFSKTRLLQPLEEETLSITIDRYLLASYDENNAKGYIVSEGENYLSLGNDAHDALNNILKYQGYNSLFDEEGNPVSANQENVYSYHTDFDKEKYALSSTGEKVTNQFTDCDLNTWVKDSGTYLSRQDWKKTYPNKPTTVDATEEMIFALKGNTYVKSPDAPKASEIKIGDNIGLNLCSMKDIAYDDPLWDTFVRQMNLKELSNTVIETFACPGNESIGQKSFTVGDGIDSNGGSFTLQNGTVISTMTYASKPILTGTFNTSLYRSRGSLMGEEALFTKNMENYNLGLDLHRTPFGGRNFEYMSEDATLSYLASIDETLAMEEKGTHAAPKHFAGNDQETYR
ncbi:MAG: glycoside hydrolase family 3 C-terminal domain-containing protein, partial [Bacilli bacterium]